MAVLPVLALMFLGGCGAGISPSIGTIVSVIGPIKVSASLPTGVTGLMYSSSMLATGGSSHYIWKVIGGSIPDGLQLDKNTGTISGVPRTSGTTTFTASVSDDPQFVSSRSAAPSITVPLTITIVPQLAVADASMPPGVVKTAYSRKIAVTGGQGSYSWTMASGQVPTGITAAGGLFAGTPTTAGTYNSTWKISDTGNPRQSLSLPISITVTSPAPAVPPLVAAAVPAQKLMSGSAVSLTLGATGGTPAYSWKVASGSLPSGLNVSSAGVISGTPTTAGTYSASLSVEDRTSPTAQTASTTVAMNVVSPLSLQVPAFASGTVNSPYTATFQVSGGTPSYTWSTTGSLPSGLTISNGVISGTPKTAGSYSFTVQVADSDSPAQTRTATGTITIADAPAQRLASAGTTWYVRKDGGSRYSVNRTSGQCDGKSDAAYSGVGVNQHCAFNDVRYLWQDGSYISAIKPTWVIAGGDTAIIRGSIDTGGVYRIGWNNKYASYEAATDTYWGVPGDPYGSGVPLPPAGTAAQHTRILGENYGSCHVQSQRTQLHGGFGVYAVLSLQGASYVDMQCLDITDFSSCGRSGQMTGCNTNPGTLDDYATNGIMVDNTTNHITLTDVRVHGMAVTGMSGPTGDGNTFSYFDLIGNAGSGWNADNGTVGVGSTLVQNFNISWNGCAEEYPIAHAMPYNDCTDDNIGGYGDGFGTASVDSKVPWNITFDQGTTSYNTQDGLDALHLIGAGSTMTISRVLAYGNMGQQIKVGGAGGTAVNNVIITNCNAMRQAIPGTPSGFNSRLGDFCRASDTGIVMSVQDGSTTRFDYNTVYSASATTVEIDCGGTCTAGTDLIDFRNNIILGFKNSAANGYIYGGTNDYANPLYLGGTRTFLNAGSIYDHNVTYHPKSNWSCPSYTLFKETNAMCVDPGLTDETWHLYDAGDMSPVKGVSLSVGAGVSLPGITTSYNGAARTATPTIGAYE